MVVFDNDVYDDQTLRHREWHNRCCSAAMVVTIVVICGYNDNGSQMFTKNAGYYAGNLV